MLLALGTTASVTLSVLVGGADGPRAGVGGAMKRYLGALTPPPSVLCLWMEDPPRVGALL